MVKKKITTAARDLATASVVAVVAMALFVYFDVFEGLQGWMGRYEVLEFDELLLLPAVLAVLLAIYYRRERGELRREMAERERVGEDLRGSEAGLVAAQRIAGVGNFEYDFGKDEARWSDEVYRIFGFEPQSFVPTYKTFFVSVHPDDKRLLLEAIRGFLYRGRREDVEYRVVRPDGEVRCVYTRCEVVYGDGGEPLELVGTLQDVTERVRTEERLKEAEERYRTLVERVPAITYVHAQQPGEQSATNYISPQIETVLGYTPEEYAGDPEFWKTVLHPEDRERVLAEDERTGETGEAFRMDFRVISKSGETVWLREDGRLLRSEDGFHQLWHGIMFDITELKRVEEDLRHRFDFEKIIADTLAKFVNLAPAEVDSGIEEALGETGEFAGVDRSYVFLISEDGVTIENTHEWCAAGIESQIENLKGIPIDTWSWAMNKFRNGEVNHVPRVADLPAEAAAEKEECEAEGIRSFLQIPMLREGVLVGFVGFDSVLAERAWSEDEIMLLKTVGELFTNALERKWAQRALQEAETRYRTLIENIPAVTYVHPVGDSAALSYMSPQIESMLGFTPEEYISEPGFWIERLHPDDHDRVIAADQRSDETLEPFSIEYRLRSREGRYEWVREEGVVVHDEEGNPQYWQGFLWNISDRKEAEERLQEAESRYRTLVEQTPIATYRQEAEHNGTISYISPQIQTIIGYTPEEYVAEPDLWIRTTHPEDRERVLAEDEHTDRTGEPFRLEFRKIARDGRVVWVRDEAVLVRDEEGQPLFWQGVVSDITERKEAEKALEESEAKFRTLVERTPAITYTETVAEAGATSYVSPQVERILGYRPEEMDVGDPFWGLLHPDDRDRVVAEDEHANETGEPFNSGYRLFHRDGRVVWVRDEAVLVSTDEDGTQHWQGVIYDITDRMEAEAKLREAEARYRALVEQTPAITYVDAIEDASPTLYMSPQVEEVLGYTPEEWVCDDDLWTNSLHPGDRERILEEHLRTNETLDPFKVEYRMIARDGRVVWVRDEAVVVWSEMDGELRWQGNLTDITDRKEAEAKLREAEAQYRTLVEQMPAVTYVQEVEHNDKAVYISPQMEDLTGHKPEDFYADPDLWYGITHPDDLGRMVAQDEHTDETGEPFELEYRMVHRDGRTVWVRDEALLVEDPATGQPRYWQGLLFDITERKRAEEAVRRSEAGLAEAQRMASRGSWEWDVRTGEVRWSDETYRIYGREPEEFVPTIARLMEVVHPDDRAMVEKIYDALYRGEPYDFFHRVVRPDGAERVVHRRAEVVFGDGGEPLRATGTVQDVTERKVLEERLQYQAMHDPLTGLPNRATFTERLQQALARAGRRAEKTAVLFLDLDNFKCVNDSLGHDAGDGLLVAAAQRLASCVRAGDTLARLGGDEFTVLVEDVAAADEAVRLAERILEALREPIDVKGHLVVATASIGISFNLSHEDSAEDLLRDADVAMYRSKEKGENQHEVFDSDMKGQFMERLGLEADLRRAIERDEFALHYQPILSLEDGVIVGTEALIRWEHPTRGLVPPGEFVGIAEETQLILPIGRWVLREACRQAKEWRDRHPTEPPLVMSVNLSARQFQTPGLVDDVSRALFETGLCPRDLLLEITESVAMDDAPSTIETLRELKALGVRMAIDDFGTGHTSLAYLKRFPVDYLKIDRSFVAGFAQDPDNEAIVGAVVRLAQDLNMEVIAEGVETPEQLARLREMGCDMAQGFYWWRPLPSQMLDTVLRTHVTR